MCGIFGLIMYHEGSDQVKKDLRWRHSYAEIVKRLLEYSTVRGSDASGLAIMSGDDIDVFKTNTPGTRLPDIPKVKAMLDRIKTDVDFKAVIGHTRAQTKGSHRDNNNNHPIITDNIVGVHNGIISNDETIFDEYRLDRRGKVDSEVIFQLIEMHRIYGESLIDSVKKTADELIGSFACAFLCADEPDYVTIFTNAMSYSNLIVRLYPSRNMIMFASSENILHLTAAKTGLPLTKKDYMEFELHSEGYRINIKTSKFKNFKLSEPTYYRNYTPRVRSVGAALIGEAGTSDDKKAEKPEPNKLPTDDKRSIIVGKDFIDEMCSGDCTICAMATSGCLIGI